MKAKPKKGEEKQQTGRGKRMALEKLKKAAETAQRGFLTPIVDLVKAWLGEEELLIFRRQMIQLHTKEINQLSLDSESIKLLWDIVDHNKDNQVTLDELRDAVREC